ncbi:NUDIX hydrolase [Microlunatus parietis]|uniref:ADP-ribose pyrophosphatase n=1 Tax=Microlunatus parietis TaxID=682979 RepID=A0A7Y9IAI7_9ACTN|nr:NUDIX hydrolase [Microlunatus parietis]NYE73338.1 ADP-ribose pyrophosphatase [Microlunatus parietis]
MEPWTLLDSRPGSAGFVRIRADRYRLADGTECEWDILDGPDSVAVLALTEDSRVVLARQFRPGPGVVLDELPGGGVGPGEDPAAAAARELLEETGYAGEVEVVGSTWLAGNVTRRCWTAVATRCRKVSEQELDGAEQVEVVIKELPAFHDQLRVGALTDLGHGFRALAHLGLLAR